MLPIYSYGQLLFATAHVCNVCRVHDAGVENITSNGCGLQADASVVFQHSAAWIARPACISVHQLLERCACYEVTSCVHQQCAFYMLQGHNHLSEILQCSAAVGLNLGCDCSSSLCQQVTRLLIISAGCCRCLMSCHCRNAFVLFVSCFDHCCTESPFSGRVQGVPWCCGCCDTVQFVLLCGDRLQQRVCGQSMPQEVLQLSLLPCSVCMCGK
jgi:hypothetical protein